MDDNDDDFGDDDALENISDHALQQLEQAAISSTQRPQSNAIPASSARPRIHTYGTTGLSRKGYAGPSAWRPPRPRKAPPIPTAPPASGPALPSSDYGFDEEDVIDLDEPSMVIQSASDLPSRRRTDIVSGPSTARYPSKPPLDPETEAAFAAADAELGAQTSATWARAPGPQLPALSTTDDDVRSLQARIAELEAQHFRLQQAEQDAQHAAQQKAGEIAIVRANHDKSSKEYERRIAMMQKLHAEESAKQKAELESGRKEREKMQTSNRFLQHDLAQEAERVRGLRGTGKARAAVQSAVDGGLGTPRKAKRSGAGATLGDGFDDEEVMRLVSPSKSKDKDRSGEQTPKAGSKRKRQTVDSPVPMPALSFSGAAQPVREESVEQPVKEAALAPRAQHDRYDFMQKLLHHRPPGNADRSMEALTKVVFPSHDAKTLSSILLDRIYAPASRTNGIEPLTLKLARAIFGIWAQCLEEQFYEPISLLLDLLNFSIAIESASTVNKLIVEAVPICIKTIDLIAAPTAKASRYPAYASSDEYKTIRSDIGQYIDVDEVMYFLRRICDTSSLWRESSEEYWSTVEFTFVLQMLHKAQPLSQLLTTLRMVCTSASHETFGPVYHNYSIHVDAHESGADALQKQAKQEKDMLDRLTSLLFEMPEVPSDEPAYTDEEVQELRVEILAVFKALCLTDHGSMLLSQHWSSIGRLVKFLEAQVNRLYSTKPSLGLERLDLQATGDPGGTQSNLHDLIIQTINTTVRLLHHLLHQSQRPVDLQQKLRTVRGGYHKFLLSFTRIAFSDQLVFEAGIENEVVEAAHAILDEVLSPEEGEAVMRAVETPRGTKGREETEAEPG